MAKRALLACVASVLFVACAQGGEYDGVGPRPDTGAPTDGASTDDASIDSEPADSALVDSTLADTNAADTNAADTVLEAETNPCLGVTCDKPPANTCADAANLRVYSASGTCSGGTCSYASSTIPCATGCEAGACKGDPCAGKTCNTPPANTCASASYLTAYDAVGTCSAGTCAYTSKPIFCAFGCAGGACAGDPCLGKTCATPPGNYCSDASNLVVYETPGTCSAGTCSYKNHTEFCSFGCESGACKGNPCTGVTCATPPSNYCVNATTLRSFASPGTCAAGACTYAPTDVTCACAAGKCLECSIDTDCAPGKRCSAGTCVVCGTDASCGTSCGPCGGTTPRCLASSTSSRCVACLTNADCGGDKVCDTTSNTCKAKCEPVLTSVFSEDFATPASSSWSSGADAALGTSRWKVYTTANHGVRINGGTLQITNARSSSPDHGQGYAYVRTGGSGSHYDNTKFNSILKANNDSAVVWTLNMRRDDPEGTNGGFKCSSTSSQNNVTIGMAYVLASDAQNGLNSSTSTCSSSTTGHGYAVVLGGSNRVRLVRFTGGLRNGTLTDLVTATGYTVSNYFSVRVTYNAKTDQWQLEVRNDGASAFSVPTGGAAYGYTGAATDATYVTEALNFSGPYFQTGCSGLCNSTMTTWFDNVNVGVRCAP